MQHENESLDRRQQTAAQLRAYRDAQRRAWGDVDDGAIARYLADDCTDDERQQVESTMQQYPQVRETIALIRQVLAETEGDQQCELETCSVREAAVLKGVSVAEVRRAIASGELQAVSGAGAPRLARGSLATWTPSPRPPRSVPYTDIRAAQAAAYTEEGATTDPPTHDPQKDRMVKRGVLIFAEKRVCSALLLYYSALDARRGTRSVVGPKSSIAELHVGQKIIVRVFGEDKVTLVPATITHIHRDDDRYRAEIAEKWVRRTGLPANECVSADPRSDSRVYLVDPLTIVTQRTEDHSNAQQ